MLVLRFNFALCIGWKMDGFGMGTRKALGRKWV